MEKAATITVRILDKDAQRSQLLASQVKAVLPSADPVLGGQAQDGEVVLACVSSVEMLPAVSDGCCLIALWAAGISDVAQYDGLYLKRPFTLTALQEILQRAIRLLSAGPIRITLDADVVFLPQAQKLDCHGKEISLTEAETSLLLRLWQAQGQDVPRTVLLRDVMHYSPEADSHALETLVWRLRNKLGEDSSQPVYLCTGEEGYILRISS